MIVLMIPNGMISVSAAYNYLFPVNNGGSIAFGYGYSESYGGTHYGIDIHSSDDDTIYAACDGVVEATANSCPHVSIWPTKCEHYNTFGNYIRIGNSDGTKAYYGHLKQNSLLVSAGQTVKRGQAIASMGSSGYSSGKHLHFELRKSDYSTTINTNPSTSGGEMNYSYNGYGNTDTSPPSVSRISFDNFTSTGYTLHFNVSDNNSLSFVRVYTWTSDTPQKSDDISLSGTSKDISYNVRYSDFNNESSGYIHAIWCFDTAGNRGDSDYIYVDNGVHLPYGYLDIAEVVGNQVHVKGWAYDNDAPSISIDVHVYIGDELHVIKADKDLDPGVVSYTGYHNHCFDAYFPSNKEGSQTVNAYGININRMGNVLYQGNNLLLQSGKNISLPMNGPEISDVTISQVSSKGFSVTCRVSDPSGISKVQFPTWCDTVNQSDLIWYEGNIIKGTATVYVPSSDYNNSQGRYAGRIYAYDSLGNCSIGATPWVSLTDEPIELQSLKYNGNTYKLYNSGKNWTEAKKWCEDNGGHLVTVEDEYEWSAIKQLWSENGAFPIWLGAESTSGTWKWVTGEAMTYSNWSKGEPNCDSGIEFYLGTGKGSGFLGCETWNDYPNGNYQGGFICEYENTDFNLTATADNDNSKVAIFHNSVYGATNYSINIYNVEINDIVKTVIGVPDQEVLIKLENGKYFVKNPDLHTAPKR